LCFGVGVSEIHRYPLRPEGFEEPLFPNVASKRAVMDHLSEAPWLRRASELKERSGEAPHSLNESIEVENFGDRVELVRGPVRKRGSWRKELVVEVLDRWREVGGWWAEDSRVDRMIFRVLLPCGAVIDIARERSGGWFLVGVVD
jgi:hypothetical protein